MKRPRRPAYLDLEITTEEDALADTSLARLVREARGEALCNDRYAWWMSGADYVKGDYIP